MSLDFQREKAFMPDILLTIGAVLLLIVGIIYPLVAMVMMVRRMNHPTLPRMGSTGIMVRLFLIATVPLAGILGGFAGLLSAVWESFVLRGLILATAAASLVGFIILAFIARQERLSLRAEQTASSDERMEANQP
jgi:hypothetical protein